MKKYIIFLLLFPIIINAQSHFGTIKAGIFGPSATETGFILGYEGGWSIDESVTIGWSVDWFNKNYVDKNLVSQLNEFYGPINSSLNELRAKTNLHSIPAMANIEVSWPVAHRTRLFFAGSAGLEVLLIFYRDFDDPDNTNFKGAFDFNWRLGGGILYELGRRSDAFFELTYHSSKPAWQYSVDDNGRKKVFERSFDMSGLMARVGVRFYF